MQNAELSQRQLSKCLRRHLRKSQTEPQRLVKAALETILRRHASRTCFGYGMCGPTSSSDMPVAMKPVDCPRPSSAWDICRCIVPNLITWEECIISSCGSHSLKSL